MKKGKNLSILLICLLCMVLSVTAVLSACDTTIVGKSAYEIAVEYGYNGTITEWLESLKSDAVGESAYDIAVRNGFEGTEAEWLESLKGVKGDDGVLDANQSVYELAVEQGFEGTVEEWLQSLDGASAYDLAVEQGFSGTIDEWLESLKGQTGAAGQDGVLNIGDSVYQIAVEQGFEGSIDEWLASLKGETGEKGETGSSSTSVATNQAILSVVSLKCKFTEVSYTWRGEAVENEVTYYGSGVIIEDDKENGNAYIVTNYHVVYDYSSKEGTSEDITAYLYGSEYNKLIMNEDNMGIKATFIGGSYTYDIAVLKIENSEAYKNSNAKPAPIVDSNECLPGDTVIAIGNPEGAGISATSGIISVDSEYITMTTVYKENNQLYQTNVSYRVMRIDAAVNGGNSGGGLFNSSGELIGIVNAKVASSSIENIAYAIPSNIAKGVAYNIIRNCEGTENTKVMKCLLGITLGVSDSYAYYDDETGKTRIIQKVIVQSIEQGSIADGRIEVGDEIVSYEYNGVTVAVDRYYTVIDFMMTIDEGDTVTLNIVRDGEDMSFDMTTGAPTKIG